MGYLEEGEKGLVLLIKHWQNIKSYCVYNHLTIFLLLLVVFFSVSLFIVFYFSDDTSIIFNTYFISVPANIILSLLVLIFGLPKADVSEDTILDKIPKEHLKNYYFSTSKELITKSNTRAIVSNNKFSFYWTMSFIFICVLYLTKFVCFFIPDYNELIVDFFINLCDIISTVFFSACLIIISVITFDKSLNFHLTKAFNLNCIFGAVLIILEIINTFGSKYPELKLFISLLIGLYGGFVFAKFTGRLDSKFIRLKGITFYLFYLYAFLLIFFPLSHSIFSIIKTNNISQYTHLIHFINDSGVIISYLSFLLKTFIFYKLTILFREGKMLIYFVRMNRLQAELIEQDNSFRSRV